jgi:prepilin-type N-terminal cleavage/methylation domain-containing protein
MNKLAFTLVEILVVITIIALLSVASFSSFFTFISSQDGESQVNAFAAKVENFELESQSKNILNYSLFLGIWTWYTYELNRKSLYYTFASFPLPLWSFSLTGNTLSSSSIRMEHTDGGKFVTDQFFQWWASYTWIFTIWNEQIYTFYVDEKEKNKLWISYYGLGDKKNDAKNLSLVSLWSGEWKTWQSFTGVLIKNVSWKKILESPNGTLLSQIYLFFEKGWKEYTLTLP